MEANQDRLRRLKETGVDDTSLADPDDILDNFMTKQVHNRYEFRYFIEITMLTKLL